MAVDLSLKAKTICKRNYKDNCGKCEIRKACIGKYGVSNDSLDKWVAEVNLLTEGV
jgi:MoaA/NifB/PqqE/SkfB family radical SAM enzyme